MSQYKGDSESSASKILSQSVASMSDLRSPDNPLSQSVSVDNYRTGSLGSALTGKSHKQYVEVLRVPTGKTKDYAVDYEAQVKQ